MENNRKMRRKREGGPYQSDKKAKRKQQCVEKTNKIKLITKYTSKSDSKKHKLNLHVEDKSKRRKDRKQYVLKKKRKMSTVKTELTEKGCDTQEKDKNNFSVRLKTDKKHHVHIPSLPEDFSSNWENLKQQILTPAQPKKHPPKKKVENIEPGNQPEIWFDDVDESLLDVPIKQPAVKRKKHDANPLVKEGISTGLTKAVALDCEFVGVGSNSKQNMLARISLVNHFGHCIYDTFVKPQEEVTDYRTWVSGVREEDMLKGVEFSEACKNLAEMIKGRILVGHAIKNDLKVLYLSHPKKLIRDTSKYKPFRVMFGGKTPSLKKLTAKVLDIAVQEGEHSSIQDAQATMRLYTMYKQKWEKDLALRNPKRQKQLKNLQQCRENKIINSKK